MLSLIKKISELKIPMIVIIGGIFLIFIAFLVKRAFKQKYHRLFTKLVTLGVGLLIILFSFGVDIPWNQNLNYLQTKIYNPQQVKDFENKSRELVVKEAPQKLDFNKLNNTLGISEGNVVNLSALIREYKAGEGLSLDNNTFSLTKQGKKGTYGSKTKIPQIKVDSQGRILDITEKDIDFVGGGVPLTEAEVDNYVANNGYLLVEIDGSTTNELNTNFFLSGDSLTVTDNGGNLTVDLSKYISNTESIDELSDVDTTTTAPLNNQVLTWNGTNWVPATVATGADSDWTISGNNQYSAVSGNVGIGINNPIYKLDVSGATRITGPVTIGAYTLPNIDGSNGQVLKTDGAGNVSWGTDNDTTYTNGNGLSLTGTTFSVNSPTCAGTDKLQWNGTSFVCSADVDTDTTYSAGTGLALSGTVFSLSAGIDLLSDVDTTTTAPTNGQILSWDGSNWVPASTSSLETVTNIANTITGHKIADYTNESGTVQNINETITSLALNGNSLDYTAEDGATTNINLAGYLDNTDDQTVDVFNIQSNILHLSLEDDGQADYTVDLSPYLDNTDAQTLSFNTGTNILSLTNGGTVDLSSLNDEYTAGTGLALSGSNVFSLNSGIDNLTDVDTTTNAPTNNQVLAWDGSNWVPANDNDTTYTAGNGLNLTGITFSVNSPTCSGTDKLQWNGTSFVCSADVDTDTTYSAGTGLALSGTTFSLSAGIDLLSDVDTSTTAPTNGQILSWNGSNWVPANDNDTTYTASGTLLNLSGTTFSVNEGTLTNNRICTYVAGTGLVCNTDPSSLGSTTFTGLTDTPNNYGTNGYLVQTNGSNALTYINPTTLSLGSIDQHSDVDITTTAPTNGQVLSWDGSNWVPANDNDTTYTAGNGLNLTGTTFSVNSPTCSGTDKLQWNGISFVCSADVDTDTTYSAGTGLALSGTTFSLNAGIDLLSDVDTTTTVPTNGDLLTWDGANWVTTSPTNYTNNIYTADGTLAGNRSVDLNSHNLIFNNGNVGIGISSPTDTLHIAGSLRVGGALKDNNNSAGTTGQVLTATATGFEWQNPTSCVMGGAKIQGNGTVTNSYGIISSVNRTNTGRYTINFSQSVNTDDYYVHLSKEESTFTRDDVNIDVSAYNTNNVQVIIHEGDNGTVANVYRDRAFSITIFDANCTALSAVTSSDRRLKKNIENIEPETALGKVLKLQGVSYKWDTTNHPFRRGMDNKPEIGFIAQDVQKVLPEVVNVEKDGYLSLEYGKIVAVTVEAIKDIWGNVESNQQNIVDIQQDIQEMKEERRQLSDNIITLTDLTTQITTTLENHEQRIVELENKLADLNISTISDTQNIGENDNSQVKNAIQDFAENLKVIEKDGEEISFDLDGNLTVKELTAEKITTGEIVIDNKNNKEDEQSVGRIIIPAGETSIKVESKLVDDKSHIILTPHQPVVVGLGKIKDGKSFEIKLKDVSDKDLEVEWLIVLEK